MKFSGDVSDRYGVFLSRAVTKGRVVHFCLGVVSFDIAGKGALFGVFFNGA